MARHAFLDQPDLSPLYATTVRIAAAAVALIVFATWRGNGLHSSLTALRKPRVLPRLLAGTLAGPILGMTCYIAAMKYQPAGIVVTITFMTPLLVMPLGAWHYGTRIGLRALGGAAAALAGIILLGLFPG
jgi:drug/metabolite transporter (DMT)-like permease